MNGPNAGTYWVIPGKFLAGPNPASFNPKQARENITRLLDVGVNTFINLMEADKRDSYEAYLPEGVTHRNLPIEDFGTPSHEEMREILDTIDMALLQNRVVYVHCLGGIGRTGTVVGCYLVRHGKTGVEALQEITRLLHSGSPETPEQRQMILNWREE